MTVQSQLSSIAYTGDGVTITFAYNFRINDQNWLKVYIDNVLKTLTTDYSVTGVSSDGGGNIVFVSAPANASKIFIVRNNIPYTQLTDYVEQDSLPVETIEAALDKVTFLTQQTKTIFDRSIKVPASENAAVVELPLAAVRANKVVAFDADGNVTVETVITGDPTGTFLQSGVGAVARTYQDKVREIYSIKDFGATGDGSTDDTDALEAATLAAGASGHVLIPAGNYKIISSESYNIIQCGALVFNSGGVLVPTPGSSFILDAQIIAGDIQCLNVGKTVTGCDCEAGSTALRSWTYGFESTDAGESITLTYGGAYTGAAAEANYVRNRVKYTTTVASYTNSNNITLSAAAITPIRQDYVINAGYANINTGVVVIGNGTFTFTSRVGRINVKWFGATGDGSTDDSYNINKALFSITRQYAGQEVFFPAGTYVIGTDLRADTQDVSWLCNPGTVDIFRKNSIPLEQMNMVTGVWRGRYGGGGPTKVAENWTWDDDSNTWGGDWAITQGLYMDGLTFNGNVANQPALTAGTGHDGWDAGVSLLYVKHFKATRCKFVNMARWGIALSTLSHYGSVTNCFFESCGEGGIYSETSDYISFTANTIISSPAAGWNMGAITFLSTTGGVISDNIIDGGNNGIYVRNDSMGIQVCNNTVRNSTTNGIWITDETSGSNRATSISVNNNTVDTSTTGINISYCDGATFNANTVTNSSSYGIYCAHSNYQSITNNAVTDSTTKDILIDSGTTLITVAHNVGNCKIQGTSSTNITFDIPAGYTFSNTTSPAAGNLSVIVRDNYGDGNGRHSFKDSGGGITLPAAGSYDKYPLDFAGTVLWVDGSGKLRIKTGYPTSDTDGTIVGTQS